MGIVEGTGVYIDQNIRLLRSLSEELKLPLTQISTIAELNQTSADKYSLRKIETTADIALKLIDSYVLSSRVLMGQQELALSPVSLTATLYDTAQYLDRLAKLYDCTIEVSSTKNKGLIMAHPQALQSAFIGLAYSFITAQTEGKSTITLLADRTKSGTSAGVVSTQTSLTKQAWQQAKSLRGQARQSFSEMTHQSGAGIYVADILFTAMETSLQPTKRRQGGGLIAPLMMSKQMALL